MRRLNETFIKSINANPLMERYHSIILWVLFPIIVISANIWSFRAQGALCWNYTHAEIMILPVLLIVYGIPIVTILYGIGSIIYGVFNWNRLTIFICFLMETILNYPIKRALTFRKQYLNQCSTVLISSDPPIWEELYPLNSSNFTIFSWPGNVLISYKIQILYRKINPLRKESVGSN